jgi:hypothetical protein
VAVPAFQFLEELVVRQLSFEIACRSSRGAAVLGLTFHLLTQAAVGKALALCLRYAIGDTGIPIFQYLAELAFR